MNLRALKLLYPDQDQYAIEINPDAANELRKLVPPDHVFETSILDFKPLATPQTWNLVLIKGVLIHIHPEFLEQVYAKLYEATGRYLMVCEYYNPTPAASVIEVIQMNYSREISAGKYWIAIRRYN